METTKLDLDELAKRQEVLVQAQRARVRRFLWLQWLAVATHGPERGLKMAADLATAYRGEVLYAENVEVLFAQVQRQMLLHFSHGEWPRLKSAADEAGFTEFIGDTKP